MTGPPTLFVEAGRRATRRYRPDAAPDGGSSAWGGACLQARVGAVWEHVFADEAGVAELTRTVGGASVARQARRQLAGSTLERACLPLAMDSRLDELSVRHTAEITWAGFHQRVVVGRPDRLGSDERVLTTVEVAAVDAPGCTDVVRWEHDDVPASLRRVARAAAAMRALADLPRTPLPSQGCAVVLEPGRAGAFFHELLGHPMEGDILASGATYLAGLTGQRIGPDWLSVTDGPAPPGQGITARVDDEGVPVRTVPLLDRGRCAGMLTDEAVGAAFGESSNGHGRRVDYRHPVIPRMWHTTARAVAGTPQPPQSPWLSPRGLQLRWMNLLTGDFQFAAGGALLHTGPQPPRWTGPCLLTGNALTVLAALRPGEPAVRGYARASKGCGKLGQFPLPTTFANSGMWIPAEAIDVGPEHVD